MTSNEDRYQKRDQEQTICRFIEGSPAAMYDVGVGVYAEWKTLKDAYPSMEVYGCEPHPGEHQEVSGVFTGKLLQVAVGETAGRRRMYFSDVGVGRSGFHIPVGEPHEVEVITLDQFDGWAGKPDRILLWADVEGHELEVLRGGIRLLESRRVHWMNLETRDVIDKMKFPHYPTTKDVDNFLRKFEYERVLRYGLVGGYPESPGDCIYIRKDLLPKKKRRRN